MMKDEVRDGGGGQLNEREECVVSSATLHCTLGHHTAQGTEQKKLGRLTHKRRNNNKRKREEQEHREGDETSSFAIIV